MEGVGASNIILRGQALHGGLHLSGQGLGQDGGHLGQGMSDRWVVAALVASQQAQGPVEGQGVVQTEVHGGQIVALDDAVAGRGGLVVPEGHAGGLQVVQVALDGAEGDLAEAGQLGRRQAAGVAVEQVADAREPLGLGQGRRVAHGTSVSAVVAVCAASIIAQRCDRCCRLRHYRLPSVQVVL